MSSRDYSKHIESTSPPSSPKLGDEYYDINNNRLYKTVAVGGSTVNNTEILLNGPALANTNISVGKTIITNTSTTITSNSGALVVAGGVGIGDSLYVANRIGFAANVSNVVSAAYQVYNPLGSIDVTFG